MYPDGAGGLLEHWPQIAPKVLKLAKENVKDKNVLQIMSSLPDDASNGKHK